MEIKFVAPSYKRPQKALTQIKYPFVKLMVKEDEADQYKANGNEVIICPNEAQGNLCRVRNYILDNIEADVIIILDDDCSGVTRWEKQKIKILEPDELLEFAEMASILCLEYGFKFWGLNCLTDKGAYMEHTPFSTNKYIGGPFQAHLKNAIRYDEDLPLKEDYDMTLQHIKKYGGCLRFNYASYKVKQAEQVGGCAMYRNVDREREQFELLEKKWGSKIIRRDNKSKRGFDFNPILKTPIRGV